MEDGAASQEEVTHDGQHNIDIPVGGSISGPVSSSASEVRHEAAERLPASVRRRKSMKIQHPSRAPKSISPHIPIHLKQQASTSLQMYKEQGRRTRHRGPERAPLRRIEVSPLRLFLSKNVLMLMDHAFQQHSPLRPPPSWEIE